MDSGYAVPDPAILRAGIRPFHGSAASPHPENIISLVRQPLPPMAGNNLHALSGLYEAGSRIKGEDMGGILSRAAAHLYMKTQLAKHAEMSQYASPSTCDLHPSCQQVVSTVPCPTPILSHDTMEITTAPTGNSSFYMMIPSKVYPQSMLREQEILDAYEPEDVDGYSLISPTYFSDIMLQAMETLEAAGTSRRLPLHDGLLVSSTPSHDPNASSTKGVSGSNIMYQSFPATTHLDLLPEPLHNVPECPNSPSKQDSSVMSAEDSDVDRKLSSVNNSTKKRNSGHRKAQQKKIVYVPFSENKQRGEAPPSDTWAWRKYGQKPIKGSPFPRGYYRCSSSKGCPARKQVERSSNNPSMVMVTYTADHNHPWPINRSPNSSKSGSQDQAQSNIEDTMSSQQESNKAENLFSSIINFPNGAGAHVVSSMDPLEDEESFLLQRDVDLCLSRTSTEGDDVFDNLGELPELSAIFSMKGYMEEPLDEDKFEQTVFL